MTLNATFRETRSDPRALHGPDRTLDAIVGTVVLATEFLIVLLGISELYRIGVAIVAGGATSGAAEAGFLIALIGSIAIVAITTIAFLVRLARGRRSWTAPLWGTILASAALIFGFLLMSGSL
jgi:hypothetical protein